MAHDRDKSPFDAQGAGGRGIHFFRTMLQFCDAEGSNVIYPMVLLILNAFYLFLGGLIFFTLENQSFWRTSAVMDIADFLDKLRKTSVSQEWLNQSKTEVSLVSSLSDKDLSMLHSSLENAYRRSSGFSRWTLSNSIFFAATIVTTIGFGHLTLKTYSGRMFCLFYALIGIPMTFMFLATIGKAIAFHLSNLYTFVAKRNCRQQEDENAKSGVADDVSPNPPLWLVCCLLLIFLVCGTASLMATEQWSFPNSVYYVVITLTTIGLGDVVPRNEELIWFHLLFIYFGLASVSVTINLLISSIQHYIRKNVLTSPWLNTVGYHDSDSEDSNKETAR